MASRRPIQSYTTLDRRFKRFRQRLGPALPASHPFKPSNLTAFTSFETLWNTEYAQLKLADSARSSATALVVTATDELFMFCSHYLQVLFLAMKRGEIPFSALALYNLPVSNDPKLPDMDTEAKLLQVASNILEGDAARLAGGGVAMTNPTAAQVSAKLTAYNNLQNAQSQTKENFRKEQTDVANIFLQGAEVMRKLYMDIEYFYNEQSPEYINDVLREWGMEFYNGPGESTTVTVTVEGGATLVVNELLLGPDNKLTVTVKTPDTKANLCKDPAGCLSGKQVQYGEAQVISAADLTGPGDQLVITNLGTMAMELEITVEG